MSSTPARFNDAGYLWAQLLATRGLLLRLASVTTTQEDFREQGFQTIALLRQVGEPRPVPESFLEGLEDFEAWLNEVT